MLHTQFTPHAFITLSNLGCIEIMLNRSNDGVYYRFNYGQDNIENEEIFESEILFEEECEERAGESYFIHQPSNSTHSVYYLSEAMRIN